MAPARRAADDLRWPSAYRRRAAPGVRKWVPRGLIRGGPATAPDPVRNSCRSAGTQSPLLEVLAPAFDQAV